MPRSGPKVACTLVKAATVSFREHRRSHGEAARQGRSLAICLFPPFLPKFFPSNPVSTVASLPGRDLHGSYLTKPKGTQPKTCCQGPRTETAATFCIPKNHSRKDKSSRCSYHIILKWSLGLTCLGLNPCCPLISCVTLERYLTPLGFCFLIV